MAVIGTAHVVREGYPDSTSWDSAEKHYDPKSTPENPIWMMVDIQADEQFARPVTLQEIKENPRLESMLLARRGMRLSVQPVTKEEWDEVISLGNG